MRVGFKSGIDSSARLGLAVLSVSATPFQLSPVLCLMVALYWRDTEAAGKPESFVCACSS